LYGYKLSNYTACVGPRRYRGSPSPEVVEEQEKTREDVLDGDISLCGVDSPGQLAGSGGGGSRIVAGGGPGGGLLWTLPSCLLCS
jgi:hypothetical protein